VKSYARLACCLYPKIATRSHQDRLVAKLLNAFDNNKDDRNTVRSLEINRASFQKNHKALYDMLEKALLDEHRAAY
jgi:hypothetical protein